MESRIVEPINVPAELAQNATIQKINEIITFINQYRYRQPTEKDKEVKEQNPEANMAKDVALRERIARSLQNETNAEGIKQQVWDALQLQNKKIADIQREYNEFDNIAKEFLSHLKFAHLTALELAIAGMMVDTLFILLYQVVEDLRGDDACRCVADIQAELLKVREKLQNCMRYHKKIFDNNQRDKIVNEFYYSDIIINLFEAIESRTGKPLSNERKDLWPDLSYLEALPQVPFYKSDEPITVRKYFEKFIRSQAPAHDDVHQLEESLRAALPVRKKKASPKPDAEIVTSSWWCAPWSAPVVKLVPVEKRARPRLTLTSLDKLSVMLAEQTSDAKEQLFKMQIEDAVRSSVEDLQKTLDGEIAELQEGGCFACLRIGTLRKKLNKKAALDYVLKASTLEEMSERATEELKKDIVCAGWFSRTEEKLKYVIHAVSAQREVDSGVDFDFEEESFSM